ncbi:MAG: FtsX-like permease family protein, partial [Opitutaceae bacterium]
GATISVGGRVIVAAQVAAIGVGLALAAPVIWFSLHRKRSVGLQSERGTASRATQRIRHGFIVAQIALAFVLLTGAGLLGLSLKRLLGASPGFEAGQVLTARLELPFSHYPSSTAALGLIERLLPALRQQPGVSAAAIGTTLPFGGRAANTSTSVDRTTLEISPQLRSHYSNGVAGDYWRALGIPLIAGRLLEDSDNRSARSVCVVDEEFARRYWPNESALGHRLNPGPTFDAARACTIVGVVGTVKQSELSDTAPLGTVYYPFGIYNSPRFSLVVHSTLPPSALAAGLRQALQEIDPGLPLDDLKPMQARIDDSLVARRSPAVLAAVFAAVALLLAALGTYGVLSHAIAQREREIGVRMALGALPQQVLVQFLKLGAKLLAVGVVLGAAGSWVAGRAMQSVLFGVGAVDARVLAATAVTMIAVVLLATFIPSRRATKVDPMVALRAE